MARSGDLVSAPLPLASLGDGLRVTALGYGAMSLTDVYGAVDDDTAYRTLIDAVDAGIRFIDTANVYGGGRSERTIARLLRERRDDVVIATKFGIAGGAIGRREVRGDPAYMREQLSESLQRLGTDHVDLYYVHRIDTRVPIEDTVGAMADEVRAGRIRHIGLSEPTAEELTRAHATHPIAAVQTEWSVISRDVERSVVPTAASLGIGFVPYAPLSRGWLCDGFDESAIAPGDARPGFPRFAPDMLAANRALRAEFLDLARAQGVTGSQLALSWLYARADALGIAVAPIPGSRYSAHVREWLPAVNEHPDAETLDALDGFAARIHGARNARDWTSLRGEPDDTRKSVR